MTRRTAGTPMANPNNEDPGKSQQTADNRNKVQRRSGTGKHLNIRLALSPLGPLRLTLLFLLFFLAARSAAEDRPVSTAAPPSHKKTSGRPPATRAYTTPVAMDDGSAVDVPATDEDELESEAHAEDPPQKVCYCYCSASF